MKLEELFTMEAEMGEDLAAFKKRIREEIFFPALQNGDIELAASGIAYPHVPELCPENIQEAFRAA